MPEGEGQFAYDNSGGYRDQEFDDRELDLEARVAAAEAEAMAGGDEAADAAVAAVALLRGHSREHAATVLSSNPYFEQVGEDEGRPVQEDAHPDGKFERLYRSGRCEVLYATGTRKEVMPSGLHTVFFCNGDVKQTAPSRRVVYYHAEADTTHVSEPDGTQIYHFPNEQVERHFTDGLKEISFPDGTVKVILPNGDVQTLSTVPGGGGQQPRR
jgi:centromere protein J